MGDGWGGWVGFEWVGFELGGGWVGGWVGGWGMGGGLVWVGLGWVSGLFLQKEATFPGPWNFSEGSVAALGTFFIWLLLVGVLFGDVSAPVVEITFLSSWT